jgi:hypothetical protein
MCHNRRHIEFAYIVVIPLSGDVVASGNNKHGEPGNLQHHVLMVILIEARITFLAKQPLIFNMFNDVFTFNALIAVNVELVFKVLLVVIDLDDALDFEHTNQ